MHKNSKRILFGDGGSTKEGIDGLRQKSEPGYE